MFYNRIMHLDPVFIVDAILGSAVITDFWWLWLFVILAFVAPQVWLSYVQEYFRRKDAHILLELKIPRELRKSPKAMEQVFFGIHALRNSYSNIQEKWWEGEVTRLFSCEMVSFGGEIHFYMWVPKRHKNMVEAVLYSQYQDLEITEVDDYISRLPPTYREVEDSGFKMFGNELKLAKEDAYPIRTYVEFEAIEEEKQLDPISATLETLSKIKPQEILWLQIILRPMDDSWKVAGEKLLDKLLGEIRKRRKSEPEVGTEGTSSASYSMFTPGDRELIEALEKNLAKPGFETLIRYLYFAPPELYDGNFGQRGLYSALNQYASEWLNRFKHNVKAWTRASIWYWPHLFPEKRAQARRVGIYRNYRERKMYEERMAPLVSKLFNMRAFHWGFSAQEESRIVLNTEELATIFHPPTHLVLTGPLIKRVEAKKGGPPAGLPIYSEGEEDLPGIK